MTDAPNPLSDTRISAIAQRIDRPVVLVGLMGVGKSTVGKRLAELLNLDFVDADDEIETASQMQISEIFDQFGEPYFRDGERRVISRLISDRIGVIATGGGAFCDAQTRALILEQAIAVWIDADIATLVERTSRKNTRPLLQNGNPEEILTRLYHERKPAYSQAPVHVMSQAGPHAQTAYNILEAIDQWL